jgi:hypothetical protein
LASLLIRFVTLLLQLAPADADALISLVIHASEAAYDA